MIQILITLLALLFGALATYGLTKLYMKIFSKRIKEEFSWFGGKTHRKILKKYGLGVDN